MIRLRNLAYGAFVITCTAAHAQNVQLAPETADRIPGQIAGVHADLRASGLDAASDGPILIGQDKVALDCPAFCVLRRASSPEFASVGEREVLTNTVAMAASGSKLHIDNRRSARAQTVKLPSAVSVSEMPTVATQNEFRPALDPVLAAPTTKTTE